MNARRAALVAAARGWLGTPYMHQASRRGVGCDCLGLLRGVWREVVGAEPEPVGAYAPDWAEATGEERLALALARWLAPVDPGAFEPGDVLLFRWRAGGPAGHCAVATSATHMIHAHAGACVCEVAIAPWRRRRLAFAFAFPASPRR